MAKRRNPFAQARRNVRRRARRSKLKVRRSPYNRYWKRSFAKKVMRVVNSRAERKEYYREIADNVTLKHNEVNLLAGNAFQLDIGTQAEGQQSRIGQKIFLTGLKIRLIIESQQYRPNVDYWLYLIRNKDNPDTNISKTEMFEGLTDQLPTDFLDTDKVQVYYCKKFKPRMPNPGIDNAMATDGIGESDGNAHNSGAGRSFSNPKTIYKCYIPFNRTIHYRDESLIPCGPQKYQWVIVAYNNNSTINGGTTWPCGHLWMAQKMAFTDV